MKNLINATIFKAWLPLAVVTFILSGMIYVVAQQSYRQSANDPQMQLAQDTAAILETGGSYSSIIPSRKVDLANSLAPFAIFYDDSGKVQTATAQLDKATPAIPSGLLDAAKKRGTYRVTWQPQNGVRSATVIVHYSGKKSGYVLVGRNLREVERRIEELALLVGLGLIAAWILSWLTIALLTPEK